MKDHKFAKVFSELKLSCNFSRVNTSAVSTKCWPSDYSSLSQTPDDLPKESLDPNSETVPPSAVKIANGKGSMFTGLAKSSGTRPKRWSRIIESTNSHNTFRLLVSKHIKKPHNFYCYNLPKFISTNVFYLAFHQSSHPPKIPSMWYIYF